MKRTFIWAAVALVCGLVPQVGRCELENYAEGDAAVRMDALEKQVAALQAQLASNCGTQRPKDYGGEDCGCGGLYVGAELAVLQPHVGSLSIGPGAGPLLQLTPEFNNIASPRIWAGYENADGLGGRLTFWDFDNTADLYGAIHNRVAARTLDFDATQRAQLGQLDLQFVGGVRYAKTRFDLGFGVVDSNLPDAQIGAGFEGVGPTLGLEVRRPFGCRGFALVGGVRGSWLFGNTNATMGPYFSPEPALTVRASDHMMEVTEGRIGLEWAHTLASGSHLFARVAYEAQAWQWAPLAFLVKEDIGFVGPAIAFGFSR